MNPIVVKFGGSSLATAAQFEKVAAIIRENPARRYVVASAPGKRFDGDTKVTDLLYRCYDAACAGQDPAPVLSEIRQRFADIVDALHLSVDLEPDFTAIEAHLRQSPQRDYMASRGEYLNSKLLASTLHSITIPRPFMKSWTNLAKCLCRPTSQSSWRIRASIRLFTQRSLAVLQPLRPAFISRRN